MSVLMYRYSKYMDEYWINGSTTDKDNGKFGRSVDTSKMDLIAATHTMLLHDGPTRKTHLKEFRSPAWVHTSHHVLQLRQSCDITNYKQPYIMPINRSVVCIWSWFTTLAALTVVHVADSDSVTPAWSQCSSVCGSSTGLTLLFNCGSSTLSWSVQ